MAGRAGDPLLVLPPHIQEILTLTERGTGSLLTQTSAHVFQRRYLDQAAATGGAVAYAHAGVTGCRAQPQAPGTVSVVSASGSDMGSVRVFGVNADGSWVEEKLTLSGTVPVAGARVFTAVTDWSKDKPTDGVITLSDASGAVLDRIDPRLRANRCIRVRIMRAPGDPATFYVCGKLRMTPLVRDEDVPMLPVDGALHGLGLAAVLRESGRFDQASDEEARAWKMLEQRLGEDDVLSDSLPASLPMLDLPREDLGW